MGYPGYPEYTATDKGVAHPKDWPAERLRFSILSNPVKSEVASWEDDTLVSFVPMEAVGEHGGIDLSKEKPIGDVYGGYTYFADDDIVIAKITPCFENGKGAISEGLKNGVAFGTTEFHVVRPLKGISKRWLFYLTMSDAFRNIGASEMLGAGGQKRVPETFIKDFRTGIPSAAEQQIIADFLDWKTGQIDGLIAKKKQLIEKLKEKRLALITQAVTKGLNPNASMRDSGIPWLGEIPKHWEVRRLKFILKSCKGAIKTGPFGSDLHSSEMIYDDVKVYNQKTVIARDINGGDNYISKEKFKELEAFEVFKRDLLITTRGTIGRCMVVPEGAPQGILHPCLMRIQVDEVLGFNRFIEILIQDSGLVLNQLQLMSNATTIEVIYSDSLKEVLIPIPPEDEQRSISVFIDSKISEIDGLINKNNQLIEKLTEYRTALITAATTGKIDLRNVKIGGAT